LKFLGEGTKDKSDKNSEENRVKKTEQNLQEIAGPGPVSPEEVPEITVESYLKAGYSLLYIRTEEDHRAVGMVKSSIESIESMYGTVTFGEWRSTTGLLLAPAGQLEIPANARAQSGTEDIVSALRYVQSQRDPHVVIYHNLRQFIPTPGVIQQLKDAAFHARLVGSHIVIVGASLEPPPELQNLMTVYDMELPSQEKFMSIFRTLAGAYQKSLKKKVTNRDIELCASSAVGMTELQGENAIALSIAMRHELSPTIIQLEKEQAIKRNDVLEFVHVKETMDHLGGFKALKEWVAKRQDAFTPEAKEYGLKYPKGILMVGTPGCGKSLSARCISHYLKIPLLKFDIGKVFRSLMGTSEGAVRSALKTAEAVAPVVLWIEEIEKSMAGSQSSGSTDSGTTARVMSTILTWMQENKKPVFLVATANNVTSLPPELLRKGRFSEIWGVIEPTAEEREEIWKIHIGLVRPDRVGEFNIKKLVDASDTYTGAEIEGVVEEAMFDAWSDGRREMTTEDLLRSVNAVVPQSKMSKENIDAIREWMTKRARFVSGWNPFQGITKDAEGATSPTWRKIHTANEPTPAPSTSDGESIN
jgi:ATP-dependent 26S proteasome regulatory subunit